MKRSELIGVLVGGLVIGLVFFIQARAEAAETPGNNCRQAWQHVHSARAQVCRDKGWVIKHRLVVSPKGIVTRSTLPHCSYERQRSAWCTWNVIFTRDRSVCDGDCYRAPYWADRQGRIHYVLGTPQRKELLDPLYVDCEYVYCGIVGPDEEDRAPVTYPIRYPQVEPY